MVSITVIVIISQLAPMPSAVHVNVAVALHQSGCYHAIFVGFQTWRCPVQSHTLTVILALGNWPLLHVKTSPIQGILCSGHF